MLIDISRPIKPAMAIYPNNPEVVLERVAEASKESSALTRLTLGSHTGTHIDAPSHILHGAAQVESYSLDQMVGRVQVTDLSSVLNIITASDLPAIAEERVVIKTGNSDRDMNTFYPDFVALDESAAQKLVDGGVKLVGIDAPSIKKKGVRDMTHAILLEAGVVIIEGLWLRGVPVGVYRLMCLPLPLIGLDGAPARVVLESL